mmetsp:Transcript_16471/g.15792  ORF Transcript_16471/g.15792 Transcript_16471/m.15792 type:complete len:650 (-) Transcript_16471:38-1987(-)|eukprot:CAMPEP_0119044316 /NCGR_PEP_ID=MMETSP1177-20130426/30570_1 /TAXON_ID=2985 /ORGANISM="Ochromonas sp, Strain CCMP1899" /LENGTH=649 /DNA_ID=CAMNT_0007014255 /DNA_START=45 /DNA_END=1997 /DNA_ORIENTATION=+
MSTFKYSWTEESHSLLQAETRKNQFDFEKVSNAIKDHYSDSGLKPDSGHGSLTANDCRMEYAKQYLSQPPISNELESSQKLEIEDDMTFEQIMEIVEIRKVRSDKRKEKIFNKVLNALGHIGETNLTEDSEEIEQIKFNLAEKKRYDLMEIERKETMRINQEEDKWLAEARERLKERYSPGSVDGEGEGSFPYPSPPSGLMMEGAGQGLIGGAEEKSMIKDDIHEVDKGLPYTFDAENLFENEYLDVILEQIEKELEANAQDKNDSRTRARRIEDGDDNDDNDVEEEFGDTGESSELFEVLAVLEKAAEERAIQNRKNISSIKTIDSQKLLQENRSSVVSTDSVRTKSSSDVDTTPPSFMNLDTLSLAVSMDDNLTDPLASTPSGKVTFNSESASSSTGFNKIETSYSSFEKVEERSLKSEESSLLSEILSFDLNNPLSSSGYRNTNPVNNKDRGGNGYRNNRGEKGSERDMQKPGNGSDEEEEEEGSDDDSDDDWDNIRSKMKGSSSAHTVQPIAIITTATPSTPTPINAPIQVVRVNSTPVPSVSPLPPPPFISKQPSSIEVNIINPEVNITNPIEVNITNSIDKNSTNETNGDVYLKTPEINDDTNVQQNDSTYVLQQSGSLLSGRSTIREPKKRTPRVLGPSNKG